MRELLSNLGLATGLLQRVWLVSLIAAMTSAWIGAAYLVRTVTGVNPLYMNLIGWGAWFTWHGRLFPMARERFIRATPASAYRKAFFRHIVPGASYALSQALCPIFYGCLLPHVPVAPLLRITIGGLSVCVGTALVCLGFYTIGVAAAGFIYEYRCEPPPLITHGIYRWLRHPIYVGGILSSFGASLLFNNRMVLALGVVNMITIPFYCSFEDSRLTRIFGSRYATYRSSARLVQLLMRPGPSVQPHTNIP